MDVTLQALMQGNAAAVAKAAVAMFKSGQVLQALVVGQSGSGLTQLKIGDVLVEAKLPQPAQPGTMLQLQVKTGGPAPQLVLVSQQSPATQPAQPQPLPMPATVMPLPLPEVEMPTSAVPTQQVPSAAQPAPQPSPQAAPSSPAIVVQPQAVSAAPSQVESAASAPPPATAQAAPAAAPAVQSSPLPVAASGQPVQPQTPTGAATPVVATELPAAAQPVSTAPQQAAPAPQTSVTPLLPAQPQPMAAEPQAAPPAQMMPSATPAPTDGKPAITRPQSAPTPVAPTAPAVVEPEQTAANPLLLAQAAPRVPQTMAELPRTTPSPPTQQAASPPPVPATPEQALAQMAPQAMARQNSVAPLLQSLAALVVRPALPAPIVRAALQVLAQRVVAPDGKVTARDIEQAVVRSGLFLEASLAAGTPVRGDAKAALVNLRTVLEKFLGETPPATAPAGRAPPPVNGQPPRAVPVEVPALPDAPREVARALHGETDAAISRVKLGQLAALPDTPNAPATRQPELRMELPFLIGHELVMAQLQIARDGRRSAGERKRGWTMRFAMNFAASGEVGAEIGLLGKAVNVHLWAAEPEMAEALNAALPELASALTAIGLDPGAVRIRHAVPEPAPIASGHFVDSVS